jgi:16S rRNA (guanine(1405)-N(7))-methyltransferase
MVDEDLVKRVVEAVMAGSGYSSISRDLVIRIATREIAKGRAFKDGVKTTRTVLHQISGAYLPVNPPYALWAKELADLSRLPSDPALRTFCTQKMQMHASTRERLPFLEDFTNLIRDQVGEIGSFLDLACGLNPLALPWLPMKPNAQVYLFDIYTDMVAFVDSFRLHLGYAGFSQVCDLTSEIPNYPVQVAFLLKTIPCLEQIQKTIGTRLLEGIQAETLVVTFPAYSLGGRSKGMRQTYAAHFDDLVAGKAWEIKKFEIGNELVYIIQK